MEQQNRPDDAKRRVSELLEKLQPQPDTAMTTLRGRATGRSETNLHLAVPTGIVAIPLDEIEDVRPLNPTGDPTMVSVLVKDNTKVRHLLKVQPVTQVDPTLGGHPTSGWQHISLQAAPQGPINLPGPIIRCDSFTEIDIDSTTETGGATDATDDVNPLLQCDDINA